MTHTIKQEHFIIGGTARPFHYICIDFHVDISGLPMYEVSHTSAHRPDEEYKNISWAVYPTLKQAKARYYYERRKANGLT